MEKRYAKNCDNYKEIIDKIKDGKVIKNIKDESIIIQHKDSKITFAFGIIILIFIIIEIIIYLLIPIYIAKTIGSIILMGLTMFIGIFIISGIIANGTKREKIAFEPDCIIIFKKWFGEKKFNISNDLRIYLNEAIAYSNDMAFSNDEDVIGYALFISDGKEDLRLPLYNYKEMKKFIDNLDFNSD